MNGVLIIDKSPGLTSHDVVHRVRRILGQRSVGHFGTLDPMATGVLPLVIGNFTRLAQFYLSSEKTYEGTIRFGFSTDTYDAEGEPTSALTNPALSREQVEGVAGKFRGLISQTPPPFSAKKIKGVPAYKLARQKKEVRLEPVQIEIKEFEILSVDADRAHFRARVASGTYMRSSLTTWAKPSGAAPTSNPSAAPASPNSPWPMPTHWTNSRQPLRCVARAPPPASQQIPAMYSNVYSTFCQQRVPSGLLRVARQFHWRVTRRRRTRVP